MAGPWILIPLIGVRVPVPQPFREVGNDGELHLTVNQKTMS